MEVEKMEVKYEEVRLELRSSENWKAVNLDCEGAEIL